jgi:hypothetical protein
MKTFLSFLFILFLALQGKSQIKDNFQKSLEAITLIGEELNHIVKFFEFNLLNFFEIQIKMGFIKIYIGF